MQDFQSWESFFLFFIYDQCKKELYSNSQKNLLKDLLIMKDERIEQLMVAYAKHSSLEMISEQLQNLVQKEELNVSDETFSMKSGGSSFKQKRPRQVSVPKNNFRIRLSSITDDRLDSNSFLKLSQNTSYQKRQSLNPASNLTPMMYSNSPLDTQLVRRKRCNTGQIEIIQKVSFEELDLTIKIFPIE